VDGPDAVCDEDYSIARKIKFRRGGDVM
jgi:hypothetical protein